MTNIILDRLLYNQLNTLNSQNEIVKFTDLKVKKVALIIIAKQNIYDFWDHAHKTAKNLSKYITPVICSVSTPEDIQVAISNLKTKILFVVHFTESDHKSITLKKKYFANDFDNIYKNLPPESFLTYCTKGADGIPGGFAQKIAQRQKKDVITSSFAISELVSSKTILPNEVCSLKMLTNEKNEIDPIIYQASSGKMFCYSESDKMRYPQFYWSGLSKSRDHLSIFEEFALFKRLTPITFLNNDNSKKDFEYNIFIHNERALDKIESDIAYQSLILRTRKILAILLLTSSTIFSLRYLL